MAKRVVIVGTCGPSEDTKALKALTRFVCDTQPDEIICNDLSIRLLEILRGVYDGPLGVHGCTKDDSFNEVLCRCGAGLLPEFYNVAPGWITTDGLRGQISLSRIAGNTALNAAIKFNTSVVMGHTHRLGLLSQTRGFGGDVKAMLTGMEVGHLDQRQAEYLKGGTGNWQMGFGLLTVESQYVKPEIVPIHRGRFTVDGEVWEL
jgi:hypothetical protein